MGEHDDLRTIRLDLVRTRNRYNDQAMKYRERAQELDGLVKELDWLVDRLMTLEKQDPGGLQTLVCHDR
jgi:hypothetical protein